MPDAPARLDLPATLRRSPRQAQELFLATLGSAIEEYGEGERARRTAFASLKHSYEKVGDHWERKATPGPSDAGGEDVHGGVDANARRDHLLRLAARLDIRGRSRMTKAELVEALERANAAATRQARS